MLQSPVRIGPGLALLLALATPLAAQESARTPVGLRFTRSELESPAGERSGMPHLAQAGAEGLLLSWLAELEGQSATLAFARLDSEGWGPAQAVAEGQDWFNNWADRPSIESLDASTLLVHWLQRMGAGTYAYGVRFSLSRNAGKDWDQPRWLHADQRPVEHGFASFAAIDENTFGALWLDGRATGKPGLPGSGFEQGPQALYFRTIGRDGKLGPEECIDAAVCDCCPTALKPLGAGRLVLSYRDRTPTEQRDVMLATYADGRWQAPQMVDQEHWTIPGCPVNGPSLASLGAGFGLAWYTGAGDESRLLAAFGEALSEGFDGLQVDQGAPEGRPSVVLWDAQTLLVSWLEHTAEGPAWLLRSVHKSGLLGAPFVIAKVPGNRASGYAALARSGDGLVFAWTDPGKQRVLSCRLLPKR